MMLAATLLALCASTSQPDLKACDTFIQHLNERGACVPGSGPVLTSFLKSAPNDTDVSKSLRVYFTCAAD